MQKHCFFDICRRIRFVCSFTRPLCQNTDGGPLIEFGLLAPLFLLAVMGTLDFGIMMTKWVLVDNALNQISRERLVDSNINAQSLLEQKTFGLVKFNGIDSCLIVRSFNTLNALNSSNKTCSTTHNTGGPGDFVLYHVIFTHHFITPIGGLLSLIGSGQNLQSITFTTSTVLRNE